MRVRTITLIETGHHKDGGTITYEDQLGNKYWKNYKIGEKKTFHYGKLLRGDFRNKDRVLAVGSFYIENTKETIQQ